MIVRILGEGQYDVDEQAVDALNRLDTKVEAAIESGDEESFEAALSSLLAAVRSNSTRHDPDSLDESELILPPPDATIEEVRELLGDDGLIPG